MWNKIEQRLKSKTYWMNLSIAFISIIAANMPYLSDLFGEYYVHAFILVTLANIVMREWTTMSISEK